ncbi:MAG TPA: tricarballylate utilization 4Fe-4S protein TcuB [Dehalococcoidia bacterium]|nr:tricarballylate utilization 4Fe-4S protein TcuB [Dehalococcoidia bacterium]
MPDLTLVQEVERQLTICNACRYCEGYCAVFPAMELRRTFDEQDVIHLSNLCFDCRACYNACPYTPPHEYDINLPRVFAEMRVQTYGEFSGPRLLSKLFRGNGFMVGLAVAMTIAVVFGSVLLVQGADVLFGKDTEEGSFYRIVPYWAMVVPAMLLSGWWLAVFAVGAVRFWRSTGARPGQLIDARSFWRATKDAFGLEYLKGGGEGCDYPTEKKSMERRLMHHLLVIGVALDLASTTLAAVYHNFMGRDAPYDYTSWPVVLGAAGGVLILVGGLGLLRLKFLADDEPSNPRMLALDFGFLWLILLAASTGLMLMLLRATAAQGVLLTVHLGTIAALYLALPYGKFAHVVYRYAALVRYHVEMERGDST